MTIAANLPELSLSALVLAAAACDVRTRRVPNQLIALGLVIALVTQCLEAGVAAGSWAWLTGAATGMGLFIGLYLIGGMGAGDVKLMGAVGAFTGALGALHIALLGCIAGGALALVMTLMRKEARAGLSNLLLLLPLGIGVTRTDLDACRAGAATKVPYAVAIAIGALLVAWGPL